MKNTWWGKLTKGMVEINFLRDGNQTWRKLANRSEKEHKFVKSCL